MAYSGGGFVRYSLKMLTGKRGPPVAYILGLNMRSGTNLCSLVRVLLPRTVSHSTCFILWKPSSELSLRLQILLGNVRN